MMKKILFSLSFVFVFGNLFSQWVQVGQGGNAPVNDLIVYNNVLVAGGQFNNIGGGIATWDGNNWSAFGQGVDSAEYVYCFDTLNTNLYAGGEFSIMDGVPANNIAVWNGSNWSALGGGTNGVIACIAFYGGELYIGGQFTMAGNVPANNIAKWDGANWSALGNGLNGGFYPFVHSICVYNNELYAGGQFISVGNNIAKWDGNNWSALGVGVDDAVYSLKIFNNELYVGGHFYQANNSPCKFLARWNGTWSPVTPHSRVAITSMSVINGRLFLVGGAPVDTSFAIWDGLAYMKIFTGISSPPCAFIAHGIRAAEEFNNDIYLGGDFTQGCSEPGNFIIYSNESIVGVEEAKTALQMEIYPNPSSGKFSVHFPGNSFSCEITDVSGKVVFSQKYCIDNSEINISGLANGIYFIRAFDEDRQFTQKIIIGE